MNLCFSFPAPGGFKRACAKKPSPSSAVYTLGYMEVDFTWELERMEEICHKTFVTLLHQPLGTQYISQDKDLPREIGR